VGEYLEVTFIIVISLKAFAATEFNEIFSGGQPHKYVKVSDVLWTDCVPILRLGRTKTLKKGTQSAPET
jgi:hypothetical protein